MEYLKEYFIPNKPRINNDNEKTYHKDIYMPSCLVESGKKLLHSAPDGKFEFTEHAFTRIHQDDKRHDFTDNDVKNAITRLQFEDNPPTPFEVSTLDGEHATKACFRIQLGDRDIVIVIRKGIVITMWLNSKEDTHKTLDAKKYEPVPSKRKL